MEELVSHPVFRRRYSVLLTLSTRRTYQYCTEWGYFIVVSRSVVAIETSLTFSHRLLPTRNHRSSPVSSLPSSLVRSASRPSRAES